jgi:hypothetical protein
MVSKYTVTCFSPPSQLTVKSGQIVEVEGWKANDKIRAKSITNVTENGPMCNCGPVPKARLKLIGEKTKIKGTASKVQYDAEFVQFDIETEK